MNTIENIQELWMREQQENAIHRETIKNTMSKVRMREFYKELEEERKSGYYDRFICKTVVGK